MPIYSLKNKDTGEIFEKMMKFSEKNLLKLSSLQRVRASHTYVNTLSVCTNAQLC